MNRLSAGSRLTPEQKQVQTLSLLFRAKIDSNPKTNTQMIGATVNTGRYLVSTATTKAEFVGQQSVLEEAFTPVTNWLEGKGTHADLEEAFQRLRGKIKLPLPLYNAVLAPVLNARYLDPAWRRDHRRTVDEEEAFLNAGIDGVVEMLLLGNARAIRALEFGEGENQYFLAVDKIAQDSLAAIL